MNGTKSWYASKGIIGPIITLIALLGGFFGVDIDVDTQAVIVDEITAAASAIAAVFGAAVGIWGRVTATKVIG